MNARTGRKGGILSGIKGGERGLPGIAFAAIASGIGLASESIHAHKEKKAAKKAAAEGQVFVEEEKDLPPAYVEGSNFQQQQSNDSKKAQESRDSKTPVADLPGEGEEGLLEEHDEAQWDLDDAQNELIPPPHKFEFSPEKTLANFFQKYPAPQELPDGKLALPVVLPQRRPKDRQRGFIRAYAPDLLECGIDQTMFLDFLLAFSEASIANPLMGAINMAGFAFFAIPIPGVSQAAGLALGLTVAIAQNIQSKTRYNSSLDQLNEGFFRPRGLYAMVLTWNPEDDNVHTSININETISSNLASPSGVIDKTKRSLRPSMGNTVGVAFTETAPLVFPALDQLATSNSEEAKTRAEKMKKGMLFAADYFDRRAQAQYAADHPESQLATGPRPKFTSRYSDPNHPAASGSLIGLITGGKYVLPARGGLLGIGLGGGRRRRMEADMVNGVYGPGYGYPPRGGLLCKGGQPRGPYPPQQYSIQQQSPNQESPNSQNSSPGNQQMHNQQYPFPNQQSAYPYNQFDQPGQYQNYPGYGKVAGGRGTYKLLGPSGLISVGVQRVFKSHVLYLLIVNMPTDEQMASATKVMDEAQASYQAQQQTQR